MDKKIFLVLLAVFCVVVPLAVYKGSKDATTESIEKTKTEVKDKSIEVKDKTIQVLKEKKNVKELTLQAAVSNFNGWERTEQGYDYWRDKYYLAKEGKLETREVPETNTNSISSWYSEEKLGFSYDMEKLTSTIQEDGTIILKPKKKTKVWIEVYLSEIDNSICVTEHLNKKQLDNSIKIGKKNSETLLEVIEREYEI